MFLATAQFCCCPALEIPFFFFFLRVDNAELPKVSACNNDHTCTGHEGS